MEQTFLRHASLYVSCITQVENILQDFSGNFVLCDYGSSTTQLMNPEEVRDVFSLATLMAEWEGPAVPAIGIIHMHYGVEWQDEQYVCVHL